MKSIRFAKLSATGNDFVLFDNRDPMLHGNLVDLVRRVCERRKGVGADGVLVLENSERAHLLLRYFNADGRQSEMCGNGARAAAYYAVRAGLAPARVRLEISGQELTAIVDGNRVSLVLAPPKDLRTDLNLDLETGLEEGGYIDTGVPHYVLFVEDVGGVDVFHLGQKYRHHPAFQPRGTNVDFVEVVGPHNLRVRTYERGVEAETLACGTGVTASALTAEHLGRVQLPVAVEAPGGRLRVSRDEVTAAPVLEGDVLYVYDGVLRDLTLR